MVHDAGPLVLIALQGDIENTPDPVDGRVGQNRRIVEAGANGKGFVPKGPLQVIQGPLPFVRLQLVGQHQAHIRAFGPAQRQVHHHLVDDTADPAAGHQQHRRPQHPGHPGVAQAYGRPHPGMTRPFDHQQIAAAGKLLGGQHDAVQQRLGADHPIDHLTGGGRMQHHRRHQPQIILQPKDLGHQGHILVDIPPAQGRRFGPDRLEKADPPT